MAEIGSEQLLERIARGKIVPAILLLGSDTYLRDLCRNALIKAYVDEGARDWALARMSAADGDWEEVFQRAQMMPMLSPQQVIFVEGVEALDELGEKAREESVEALQKYLANPAPFTVLVFEATDLDKRKRLRKLLDEKAITVALEMDGSQATALAVSTAKELGAELDRAAASLIVDAVNGEPARIRMEVEKLALYTQGRGKITQEDVEELVVSARKYTVWQLADLLASSRRDAALEFLGSLLRDGEQPAGIVGVLAWMYRKMIEAREISTNVHGSQLARQLSMNPESAELALRHSRRIPQAQLLAGVAALYEADNLLKSGVANPRAVMEFLVTRLIASSAA
ncbi:MAG: DNA polymerase III subunit delta [Candidatus Acidiferrales bacterium]